MGPKWVRLAPNMTNPGLTSVYSTFWITEKKGTEIWSEKIPNLYHLVPIWPTFGSKSGIPVSINKNIVEREQFQYLFTIEIQEDLSGRTLLVDEHTGVKMFVYEDLMYMHNWFTQECQIWPPIGPDWHQMGQIWDFIRTVFCSSVLRA